MEAVVDWLLEGDPAIRWQTMRDLTGTSKRDVDRAQRLVAKEGWGADLLARQDPEGTWSGKMYSPKWVSTTYSMVLLRRFGLPAHNRQAEQACRLFLDRGLYTDGGIRLWGVPRSDMCATGLVLAILSWFRYRDDRLRQLEWNILDGQLDDGGWNCEADGPETHASMHTTINVLEGLAEYADFAMGDRDRIEEAQRRGREFLLEHRMFRSHRTGEVIKPAFTLFSFPPRWHYDVLRGLDYFQAVGADRDERLEDAVDLVVKKRRSDGRWPVQNRHPGKVFFEMEEPGKPSRWNTLRCLRVTKWWDPPLQNQRGGVAEPAAR